MSTTNLTACAVATTCKLRSIATYIICRSLYQQLVLQAKRNLQKSCGWNGLKSEIGLPVLDVQDGGHASSLRLELRQACCRHEQRGRSERAANQSAWLWVSVVPLAATRKALGRQHLRTFYKLHRESTSFTRCLPHILHYCCTVYEKSL